MPALVLFVFGLALQLLFTLAGPDGGAGWHIAFQGDAPVWQDLAWKLAHGGADDQLRLPWRPPGMLWLVSSLWDGEPANALPLRFGFAVLGAMVAPLVWLLLRPAVANQVALVAAGLCAAASQVLLIGSGLHVELVYLVGALLALLDHERLLARGTKSTALRLGLVHGALCLLRAEHALTVVALLVVARWRGATWRSLGLAAVACAAVIAPWQWHAHGLVAAYNAGAPALPPHPLPWEPAAMARLRTLPSFQQVPMFLFVSDTMRVRGAAHVAAADLDVVREAYGCFPEPLRAGLIAAYGPINFFLANTPEANGGFSAAALDRPPPLTGGAARYPPGLLTGLPRGQILFGYPPHLDAVVHGTWRGLGEIAADPLGALARCGKKLWHATQGAAPNLGGYALPIGMSGERRQVDFVTATGIWPTAWRLMLLGVALFGLSRVCRQRALWPLFAFAATKMLVVLAYFGYARQGVLCLPLVALGLAAAAHALRPGTLAAGCRPRIALPLLAALLALEVVRAATTAATVDSRPVVAGTGEPFGAMDFSSRTVVFR